MKKRRQETEMILKRSLGFAAFMIVLLSSVDVAFETSRFVSSALGDDLGGLNDCRDQLRPCKTIKQAISKADPGDVIKVFPGPPYTQDCGLEITKRVKILAEGIRPVIAPKVAVDEAIEPCNNKGFLFKFSGDKATGSVIMGLALQARIKEKSKAALILVESMVGSPSAPAVVIKDNHLQVLKSQGDTNEIGVALRVLNSSFVEIIGNQIQGALEPVKSAQGVVLEQAQERKSLDGSRVEGNRIFNHGGNGIEIAVENQQATLLIRLLKNRVERNEGHGVSVVEASNLLIEGNEIIANSLTGMSFLSPCSTADQPEAACESLVLRANLILNSGDEGIHIRSPAKYDKLQISANIIQKNGLKSERSGLRLERGLFISSRIVGNHLEANHQGIQIDELKGGSSLELSDNSVSGHKGHGMTIKLTDQTGPTNLVVRNNIMDRNAESGLSLEGFNLVEGSTVLIAGTASRANKEGIKLKGSRKITVQGNQIQENRCAGLVLEDGFENSIHDNIIVLNGRNCPNDRFQLEGTGIVLQDGSDDNNFERNVLDRNLNGVSLRVSATGKGNRFQCNKIFTSDHSAILVLPGLGVTALFDSFNNNDIVGNLGFGLRNFTDIKVNAQRNWWGYSTGPFHAELNPQGKGDRILGPADFNEWLTTPSSCTSQ